MILGLDSGYSMCTNSRGLHIVNPEQERRIFMMGLNCLFIFIAFIGAYVTFTI